MKIAEYDKQLAKKGLKRGWLTPGEAVGHTRCSVDTVIEWANNHPNEFPQNLFEIDAVDATKQGVKDE